MCENLNISCPCEYCLAGGFGKFVFPVTSLSQGEGNGLWRIVAEGKTNTKKESFKGKLFLLKGKQTQRKSLLRVDYFCWRENKCRVNYFETNTKKGSFKG